MTTFWHSLVGTYSALSTRKDVIDMKTAYANIIDNLNYLRNQKAMDSDAARVISIAITEAEGACMWAIKALIRANPTIETATESQITNTASMQLEQLNPEGKVDATHWNQLNPEVVYDQAIDGDSKEVVQELNSEITQ